MTQPWAMLVALAQNSIETRSWSTRYRGLLAIHAAKAFPPDARALCRIAPYREVLAERGYDDAAELPRGAVIAIADLVDVMAFDKSTRRDVRARAARGEFPEHEADFGDFSAGRHGLVLRNVKRLREPVPARGMLGLWTVPELVEARILAEAGSSPAPEAGGARSQPTGGKT